MDGRIDEHKWLFRFPELFINSVVKFELRMRHILTKVYVQLHGIEIQLCFTEFTLSSLKIWHVKNKFIPPC